MHLSPDAPGTVRLFFDFLSGPARQASRLTILGDLFDYWVGDDALGDPFNTRIAIALRALVESGVAVDFMVGNRDFLVGQDFADASGTSLLPDPTMRRVAGVATLLTHGDSLCSDDVAYQRFRAAVRTPEWRSAFLARPIADRKRDIEMLRARSETEKAGKPSLIMEANPDAVRSSLSRHSAQAMIHGHTHRQYVHLLDANENASRRWVLGDWHQDCGSALLCEPAGWRWLHFTASA